MKRGFTLLEVIVATVFLSIFLMVVWNGYARWAGDHHGKALAEARAWAETMGLGSPQITCVNKDTDFDGYVDCVVFTSDRRIIALECAAALTGIDGCRLPKTLVTPIQ